MAELGEKQFELDGVVFGLGCPIEVEASGWTPGQAALRTSDADNPGTDGVRPGRTLKGASTWGFSLYTNAANEDEAWASLAQLAAVWDNEVRFNPGEVVPLRYRVAGKTRVVYGQPRRWTISPNNASLQGMIQIEADFLVVDPNFYEDELQSMPFTLGAPLELDAGLLVPFIAPFTTAAGAGQRQSSILIGGDAPTPISVTFSGEVSEAAVRIGGWTAALVDPVTPGDPVTIDGRPWVRSATYRSGGGAQVSARVTRISKMILPPGQHEVIFTGIDPNGQSTVLVSWRNARRTPR